MKKLKLSLEYGCDPVWDMSTPGPPINLPPGDLPVSKELADDINKWNEEFHQLFINTDEEFKYKGFTTREEETRFEQKGINLLERLRTELAGIYEIYSR